MELQTTKHISLGSRVRLHYSLSTEDSVIDTTFDVVAPLELTIGSGQLHAGIEQTLLGRRAGDEYESLLDPSLGFGEPDAQLKFSIARSKLPAHVAGLSVGDSFYGLGPDRKKHHFRVTEANEQRLSFDGNHEHAGKILYLRVKILEVI